MRTTKPISTISFNSVDFLRLKLDELLKAKRISFWAFIEHKPEDDEGGKKYHSHVYIEPAKMTQTDDIKLELCEFDPSHPDKPLGCLTFTTSKFDPWFLYAVHDKRYLLSKGQTRRFHYSFDDIVTSDRDDLLFKYKSIDMLSLSPYADMEDAIQQGLTFAQYFNRGVIPLPQIACFQRAWDLISEVKLNSTDRNGKPNHPMDNSDTTSAVDTNPIVDVVTGEVLSELPFADSADE